MRWLRENWPSFSNSWDLPFGTLTDLIGIGVGLVVLCFTVWVALRQIQIMKRQTAMMEEQGTIALEQAASSKRQEAIAHLQQQILLEQLGRQQDFMLLAYGPYGSTKGFDLGVKNKGVAPIEINEWALYIDLPDGEFRFVLIDGEERTVGKPSSLNRSRHTVSSRKLVRVGPGEELLIGRLTMVAAPMVRQDSITITWFAETKHGFVMSPPALPIVKNWVDFV